MLVLHSVIFYFKRQISIILHKYLLKSFFCMNQQWKEGRRIWEQFLCFLCFWTFQTVYNWDKIANPIFWHPTTGLFIKSKHTWFEMETLLIAHWYALYQSPDQGVIYLLGARALPAKNLLNLKIPHFCCRKFT